MKKIRYIIFLFLIIFIISFSMSCNNKNNKVATITWKNYNGVILEVDNNVKYGTIPSYDGETPTKESTAEFSYTFNGWHKEISAAKGDTTYIAQYTSEKNKYTVTWQNRDGTVLEIDENVEYGTIPSYDGETPSTESTAEFSYIFSNWDEEIIAVTGDTTYIAQYISERNKYTVTWLNEDGTVLEIDENVEYGTIPSYDGETPKARVESTDEYSIVFLGWDQLISPVIGNITYKTLYVSVTNEYTVTWLNEDGTILEVDNNVKYGTTPSYDGETPTKESTDEITYTFNGWDKEISEVTGDTTYIAQYISERNKYTVTWLNEDGTVLEIDENVEYGTTPSYDGETPTKESTNEITYTFNGWDKEISEVTGDVTYKALYLSETNKYTVTWLNEDGTVLEIDENVLYGTTPSYDGETPTKESLDEITYTFNGWDKEICPVTGDITYTASFDEIINKYYIEWINPDDTVLYSGYFEYGSAPKYEGDIPTYTPNDGQIYIFDGWDREISIVTKDEKYYAKYILSFKETELQAYQNELAEIASYGPKKFSWTSNLNRDYVRNEFYISFEETASGVTIKYWAGEMWWEGRFMYVDFSNTTIYLDKNDMSNHNVMMSYQLESAYDFGDGAETQSEYNATAYSKISSNFSTNSIVDILSIEDYGKDPFNINKFKSRIISTVDTILSKMRDYGVNMKALGFTNYLNNSQSPSNKYTLTLNANGGLTYLSKLENVSIIPDLLPSPTKLGYKFDGWYLDSSFSTLASPGMKLNSDKTLYAKWIPLAS